MACLNCNHPLPEKPLEWGSDRAAHYLCIGCGLVTAIVSTQEIAPEGTMAKAKESDAVTT